MDPLVQYGLVSLFGVMLAAAELASRYRDAPVALFRLLPAYVYVAFNILLSLAALWVLKEVMPGIIAVPVDPGEGAQSARRAFYEVLVAGFGGAALFRSAVAKTKVGDAEIGVGPAFVIDVFLNVTDRTIDRKRASERSTTVAPIMRNIPPDFAAQALTEYCIALLQNLSAADERTLRTRVDVHFKQQFPGEMKSILIGLVLDQHLGAVALEGIKRDLDAEINAARNAAAPVKAEDIASRLPVSVPAADPPAGGGPARGSG